MTFSVSIVFILGATLYSGTTASGLLHGIILQHLGFAGDFFQPPPVTSMILPAVFTCGILVILFLRDQFWVVTLLRGCAVGLLTVLLIQFFFESATPSYRAYEGRMHVKTLMSFAPLLTWIILFPGIGLRTKNIADESKVNVCFGRFSLCFVSAFQLLICYPVPGSQIAMGTFLLIVVLSVVTSDFMKTDLPVVWTSQPVIKKQFALSVLLAILASVTLVYRDASYFQRRMSFVSLDLPGAQRLKLPKAEVRKYQRLARFLKDNSETFIFRECTQNSLYFWTQISPPNGINATIWPHVLNHDLQNKKLESLRERDGIVVISRHSNSPLPDSPLSNYISDYFKPNSNVANFKIWLPKHTSPNQNVSFQSQSTNN